MGFQHSAERERRRTTPRSCIGENAEKIWGTYNARMNHRAGLEGAKMYFPLRFGPVSCNGGSYVPHDYQNAFLR